MKRTSDAGKVEAALVAATGAMTVDEICRAAWGRVGERERNLVRVTLHRMDERGVLVKHARRYELKR